MLSSIVWYRVLHLLTQKQTILLFTIRIHSSYLVIIMRANAEYIILEFHVLCCVHACHYNIHHSDSKYINVMLHTKETSVNIDQSCYFLEEQQWVFQLEVSRKSPIVSAE